MRSEVLTRMWVLVLFTVRPWLPGYRGLRLPLYVLVVALLAGCPWTTARVAPRSRHARRHTVR